MFSFSCIQDGSCYMVNASTWLGPLSLVQPLYGYVMPVLMMITFITNSIIIIVLNQYNMSSPTNTVLKSMAVCDLLTICLPGPCYVFFYTFNSYNSIKWNKTFCYIFEHMMETMPQIFHTASNWLTVTLAVQRYIYICHPTTAKTACTLRSARMMVCMVTTLAVLHMIPRMMDRDYQILRGGEGLFSISNQKFSFRTKWKKTFLHHFSCI